MGDVSLNQPLINEDPLPLPLPLPGSIAKQGDHIQGLLSAGWTDERHSSYISSMEASFVEQLYGQENCGNDATKSHLRNGYKVIQEGMCKNIRFERNNADTRDIGTNFPQENPWLRRFRPRGASVNRGVEPMVDDYGSGTDTVREKVRTHARQVKASVEERLIGKSKEVTDQNFPDEEIEWWFHAEEHTQRPKAWGSHALLKPEGGHGRPVLLDRSCCRGKYFSEVD
ncbi:hypothetical protein U9M48_008969 [Paspalum notatum var. saurae]|uniref:Uncharacterized protein n=1 Tax=Paspalum notatum var. saurae TaxID=547442 RepID=A0AAQ3SQN5_PASNO